MLLPKVSTTGTGADLSLNLWRSLSSVSHPGVNSELCRELLILRSVVSSAADLFNLLLAAYFVIGNGTYTVLMLFSVVSVWLHRRRRTYEGLQQLRDSPLTPPVTIIIPAWNEQDVIVDSVRSVLQTDYPGL